MDLYHGEIRKGALNKTHGDTIQVRLREDVCVRMCACLEDSSKVPVL